MKNNGSYLGTFKALSGGVSGGGVTSSIRVADDGRMVNRNDTETCYFREPSGSKWVNAFRLGDNVPASEFTWGSVYLAPWCYDIDICATNSSIGVLAKNGRVYLTSNFFGSLTRLNTFKGGAIDETLTFQPHHAARSGGSHIRIDPANPDRIAIGHPVDGAYISLDRGATNFTIPASLPAPINATNKRTGVHWAFDRSTVSGGSTGTVYCLIAGRGVYRSTTGLGGAYTLIGGPLLCTAIEARGGRVYAVGDPDQANSQLWVWSGSAWSQPSGITGRTVASDPADALKVIVCTEGGTHHYSSDGGATWATYDNPSITTATDAPWLAKTFVAYFGICSSVWERRTGINRLLVSTGLGVFEFPNPPRTAANQPYNSLNVGIKQMLLKNGVVNSRGTAFMVGEDRPIWRYPQGQWTTEAEGHGPNYNFALRHGGDIDWAGADENYVVAVYSPGASGNPEPAFAISTDEGKTWVEPPIRLEAGYMGGAPGPMMSGNIAVTAVGKFIWAGSQSGSMKYTLDNGASFASSVFRHTEGGPVINMDGAVWHKDFVYRRKILAADKTLEGHALAFCSGFRSDNLSLNVPDILGMWETFDHGANWLRIRATHWVSGGTDFYQCKLKFMPGSSSQVFWVTGPNAGPPDGVTGYPTVAADPGIFFSTDKGATKTSLTGFREAVDVTFTRNPLGGSVPRINVFGWRDLNGTLTQGLWTSDNFNPASPTAATWTFRSAPPEGRILADYTIAGHPNFAPVIITAPSGGFYSYEEESLVEPGKPYRIRAT